MLASALFLLITLPWLNPFSPGPTAQVGPLLFAWACAAGVLLALAADRQRGETAAMVRALVLAWAAAAGISAAIALLQYLGASAAFGVWVNATEPGLAFANLRQRNQLATLLNIGLVALLWLVASQRDTPSDLGQADLANLPAQATQPSRPAWLMPAALLWAELLAAGNAASSSRTGLLQLLLVLTLGLWWQHGKTGSPARQLRLVLLAALLAYAVASLALPWLAGLSGLDSSAWARLRAGDAACSSRLTLWGNVLHLIGQKPWLGWGWGELDYAHFITLYPGERFCDILDNAHNLPLHLAVELGLPLALLVCGLGLWLTWRARPWREANPTRQLAWGVLAVILLHSLLEYPLWYGPFQTAAVLSLWLLGWVPRSTAWPADLAPRRRTLTLYAYGSAAVALVAWCCFAGWNYYLVSQLYLPPEMRAAAYREHTQEKVERNVWLFRDSLRFATLTTTDLSADNAAAINALAKDMLHFSPEARVVELVLDSALLLGRSQEVAFYAARYKAAFPKDYARWVTKRLGGRVNHPQPDVDDDSGNDSGLASLVKGPGSAAM